jgi:cobalt/nickel transport system permease protein
LIQKATCPVFEVAAERTGEYVFLIRATIRSQRRMHIPDGYLSPSTCAALYAASAPFWYVALRRVKALVNSSLVPLVSVFSAFSFIVMMFNLPLPGGTTGHAVGMGIAAIVLGPMAAILSISIALVIQAVFFGDGGITAIGANCFNMAIVGSLSSYAVYRLISWRASLWSLRRVIAGALAGYSAINLSALCAAIEFGIQPVFFHTSTGVPLYCPYPLSISIPAMMIGHLSFAGLAELFVTAGVVAYLQRADPALLKLSASDAPDRDRIDFVLGEASRLPSLRKLWLGLAALLIVTPLGIVASGSAWGEWNPTELSQQLHSTSAPSGMARLSTFWTAPVSRYAPAFIRSDSFGYLVSAMLGVALIILITLAIGSAFGRAPGKRTIGFVEATIRGLIEKTNESIFAEELAARDGLLQRLDPRVKLAGLLSLVIASIAVHRIDVLCGMLLLGVVLALLSKVPPRLLVFRIWLPVLSFSGLIALPAIFLVPGDAVARLPFPVTSQGLLSAGTLVLRVDTATTFAILLVLCTAWARVLKALRFFRVPVVLVVILGMTYRYLFLLLKSAQEMFEARQSRLVGPLPSVERRRIASGTVGVLLARSFHLSSEVHLAMQSRGFQGETHLLEEPAIRSRDWFYLLGFVALAASMMAAGR